MATRINVANLQSIVDRINILTKSPLTPYRTVNGHNVVNVGCFFLDGAYGGYSLRRMTEGGGESDVLQCGYRSPKELSELLYVFIRGYELGSNR